MEEYFEGSLDQCRAALARIDAGLGLRAPSTTALIFPVDRSRNYTFVIKSANQKSKLDSREIREVTATKPTVADNTQPR
tara:strand:+ start:1023 stop:1259 length:237 start_codon:yes stop_codon:yes gene_type:complete